MPITFYLRDMCSINLSQAIENKILSSFDLGQDTYPVDLAILGGNKKMFTICIGSSDGKVSLFTLSGIIS